MVSRMRLWLPSSPWEIGCLTQTPACGTTSSRWTRGPQQDDCTWKRRRLLAVLVAAEGGETARQLPKLNGAPHRTLAAMLTKGAQEGTREDVGMASSLLSSSPPLAPTTRFIHVFYFISSDGGGAASSVDCGVGECQGRGGS